MSIDLDTINETDAGIVLLQGRAAVGKAAERRASKYFEGAKKSACKIFTHAFKAAARGGGNTNRILVPDAKTIAAL